MKKNTISQFLTVISILIGILFFTTCEVFAPGLGDRVDLNEPVVGIESHNNGSYVSGSISLTGYATDDLEIKSVSVSNGSEEFTADLTGETWSFQYDTTIYSDGDHEITVTATDNFGKTVQVKVLLIVDNSPPTVLVTTPIEYGTTASDLEFNKGFTIKGETADVTRVREVFISLYDSNGIAVFTDAAASGTSSWYYTFNSESFSPILNGSYYIFAAAEDYSGNRNTYFYHFEGIRNAASDPASLPSVEEINASDYTGVPLPGSQLTTSLDNLHLGSDKDGDVMDIAFNPNSDLPQFDFISPAVILSPDDPLSENRYANSQRLTGYVEDDDIGGIATVQLAIFDYYTDQPVDIDGVVVADSWISPEDSGEANATLEFVYTGIQWTLDSRLPEGSYYIQLQASDSGGVSATSLDVPFSVSSSAPSITINSPTPGTYVGVGQTVLIDVDVKNSDGSFWTGAEMYIDPDGDGSWTDGSAILMDKDDTGQFSLSITENVTSGFTFAIDGTYTIKLRAGTGASAGNASLGITADITNPTMQITTPGDGETVNGTVLVRGTADDTAVASVFGKIEEGDIAEYSSYPANPVADGWIEITGSVYNWSFELDTTLHPDPGILTLHYFVEDVAGNRGSDGVVDHPSRIRITTDQSTDLPVINISQPTNGGRLGIDSSIIGNIVDDDMIDISTLMVSLDIGNDGTFNAPISVSSPPASDSTNASWSHSLIGVPEGEHAFTISVDDVKTNGDLPVNSTLTYTFIVDGGPPALDITAPAANSLWDTDVIVSGTTADANGVASMAFSTDGTTWYPITITPTTDGTQINWNYTLSIDPGGADDTQYNIQVRSVDQAGATSTEYLPFEVDTRAPVLEITAPPESVTVNGSSVYVGGTVSDVNGITGLYYYITPDSAIPPTVAGVLTGWTSIPIAYSWSFNFSSLDYNPTATAADYKIWIRAIDHADLQNETDDTLADHNLVFTIDQTSDRPVISFNDLDSSFIFATDNVLVGATTLSGLIEDDDLIDPASSVFIEISLDGGAWTTVDLAPQVGDPAKGTITWKHSIAGMIEGVHHAKVRARDNQSDGTVGSSSQDPVYDTNFNWGIAENFDLEVTNPDGDRALGVPFILNLGAPTVVVDTPAAYSYHNSNVSVSGSAADANGVTNVDISLDNGSNWIPLTITASNNVAWSYTYTVTGLNDGTVTYIVRATDTYTSSGIQNGQFSVDATIPTVVVAEPDLSDTVNGTVIFNGTAGDNTTLSEVYFTILPKWTDGTHITLTGDPSVPTIEPDGSVSSPGDYTPATGNYSWSDTFDTTDILSFSQGDETYIFRALSVDLAGNTSNITSVEFVVDQETDRPDIDISSFDTGGTFLTNVMPTTQQIIGTITDDDSVQSGLFVVRVMDVDDSAIIRDYAAVTDPPTTNETWKHTFTSNLPNGRYNLYIRAADENYVDGTHTYAVDNYFWQEVGPIPFTVDEDFPITTESIAQGEFLNSTFNIAGTASDSNGIKSIDIVVNGGASENLITNADPFSAPVQPWSRTYNVNSDGSDDGEVTWTITITDAFDKSNVQSYTRKVYVDTQAPDVSISGPVDGSTLNGSIYVFGLSQDIDTVESEVQNLWVWVGNDTTDFDGSATDGDIDPPAAGDAAWTLLTSGTDSWNYRFVAAPFDADSWGVFILALDNFGNYSDPIDAFDLTPDSISIIVDESENNPVISLITADGSLLGLSSGDVIEGTITDDDYIDVSTLQISFDNGTSWVDVENKPANDSSYVSFSHTLTAVAASGTAYQVLITVDDLGEDFIGTLQDIAPVSTTTSPISVSVDKQLPVITFDLIENGLTSSGTSTGLYINDYIKITGTASDDVLVQSVQLKLGDGNNTAYSAATNRGTNYNNWDWELLSGLGLSVDTTIDVLITDVHNRTSLYTYQLRVDTTDPSISFTAAGINPDTDYVEYGSFQGAYNGNYEFKGESSDNIQITNVYFLYDGNAIASTTDPVTDGWTSATGTYGWSTVFDTTAVIDGNTHYLHIIAADGAGNLSTVQNLGFLVHQDSDNPIITVTQPIDSGLLESNAKVIGTVRDDDGLIDIQISIDAAAYIDVTSPGTISGKSVNFEHDLSSLADGTYSIELQGTDSGAVVTTSSAISFDIDTVAPELTLNTITVQDRYPANPGTSDIIINSNFNGSYINNDSTLEFTATDASGVSSVDFSINGGAYGSSDTAAPYTYGLTVSGLSEGTNTIGYRATDIHGKTTAKILTIIVDTSEPDITFSNPTGMSEYLTSDVGTHPPADDAPNANGDVIVRGSVLDSSSISSVALAGGKTAFVLTNTGNTISWITSITNSGNYADTNDSYNTGDDGGTTGIAWNGTIDGDEIATNIWRFPVEVTVQDYAGNITSTTSYIDIDPDGDRPIVSIVSPSNGASVSGTFLINGTITDDDGTDRVDVQIDLNNDGDYSDSYDLDGGGISSDYEDETVPVSLTAPNGSWSTALNSSDFSKATLIAAGFAGADGNISFRIVPYDINGLAGTAQTFTIYIDSESPVIAGLDTDGVTEVVDPTPGSGTLQSGSITVRALFKDDMSIPTNNMLISFDGGANFDLITNQAGYSITDVGTTDPYQYRVQIPIDTDAVIGTGILQIQLSLTDQTNKQSSESVTYSVDNTLPTIQWNEDGVGTLLDLPFIGTPPNEIYTFKGNAGTLAVDDAFKVLGAAFDSGTISGIDKVNVYFVKGGNFLSPVDSATYTPLAVSNQAIDDDGDSGTAAVSIPFTENSNYLIVIDNRIEQGTFDAIGGIGDADGFNESLKAKSGYVEWYAFYDTLELPDGPLEIYAVAYDEAGNMSYTVVDAQIANNPPTIPSVVVGSTTIDDSNDKTKNAGSVNFTLNFADAEGIDVNTITMEVLGRYTIDSGAPDTLDGTYTPGTAPPEAYISTDFDSITPDTDSTTEQVVESVDTTAFDSGYYYRYLIQANDTDGNLVERSFYVWVNNSDSSAPTVTINDFDQSSVSGGNGHVDEEDSSLNDAADADTLVDADLSGVVTVSGTAYDDTSVSVLTVEYSLDAGANWTDAGTVDPLDLIVTGGDALLGYNYSWTFDWDTSMIAGVAEEDVLIRAYGTDGTNITAEANPLPGDRPQVIADIVPYITDISGTGFESGLLAYVKRSATGRYPMAVGTILMIEGYNLPGTAVSAVSVGGTLLTAGSATGSSSLIVDLGVTETSGDIVVITNSVSSLNNINDNTLPQNEEDNSYNANLSDNREAVFWNTSSISGTSTVTDPYMYPNAVGTDYDWMYVRSGKELYLNTGTEALVTKGMSLKGGVFNYNSSGNLMFLYNHNSEWTFWDGSFAFNGSVQFGQILNPSGYTFATGDDEAYNWNQNTNFGKLGIGNVNFYATTNNESNLPAPLVSSFPSYSDVDLNRFENLKMLTIGDVVMSRNYVAYFDTGAEESRSIVFYGFKTSTTGGAVASTLDVYSNETLSGSNETDAGGGVFANIDKFSNAGDGDAVALAGTQKNNNTGIWTPRGRQEVTSAGVVDDSEYFDLAVFERNATTHWGFIAYFDETAQSLKITANTSLYNADPTGTPGTWIVPVTVDTNAGAYVAMTVNPNPGYASTTAAIHIAYQDVSSGYLKYAYYTFNGTSFTEVEKVFVDALFGAGSNNSIIVRDFDDTAGVEYRPVITTFSSAYTGTKAPLRMSYPLFAPDDASFGAGASSSTGEFLGNWETIALPAISSPENSRNFLYLDSSNNIQLGYSASTLEEASFFGF